MVGPSGGEFRPAKVEKVIRLGEKEFEEFLQDPMDNQKFIQGNTGLMYMDEKGVCHCLLVTGEGRRDGVLVEAEGYGYARYASHVPDVAAFAYDSLSEMGYRLSRLVDLFVTKGAETAAPGASWEISFADIREQSGLEFGENGFLRELMADMLAERPEAASVCILGDRFRVRRQQELLQDRQKRKTPGCGKTEEGRQSLGSLIREGIPADTYLIHQSDAGFVPVGRVCAADLDSGVLDGFADLLEAGIAGIRQGSYGQEIELEGVPAARLMEFDKFLACSFVKNQGHVSGPEEGGHSGGLMNMGLEV